jgi:hypothetical protein
MTANLSDFWRKAPTRRHAIFALRGMRPSRRAGIFGEVDGIESRLRE